MNVRAASAYSSQPLGTLWPIDSVGGLGVLNQERQGSGFLSQLKWICWPSPQNDAWKFQGGGG